MLLALLWACAADPCAETCVAGERLLSGCLPWSDRGFSDREGFREACATWGWELHVLEDDAVQNGNSSALGVTNALCEARTEVLIRPEATCESWDAYDWNRVPWE